MPRKVAPFPTTRRVAPVKEFSLTAGEIALFDSVAVENTKILGTEVELWLATADGETFDALYGEVTKDAWDGPYKLKGWVQWNAAPTENKEGGYRKAYASELWVPRATIETLNTRMPTKGDIARVWDIPFYDDYSTAYDHGETPAGLYYTIMGVDDEGHLFDTPSFIGFKMPLARNTDVNPERRLT